MIEGLIYPKRAPLLVGHAHPTSRLNRPAPEAGMVCGAKRIRSLYLPRMTGVTLKLSTTTPPRGLASLSTINAATMRLCRADLPASAHSSRLEAAPTQIGPAPKAGGVSEARRMRSLYLPWMTGVIPKLSTTTPPEGRASLSTINAATMRPCRGDPPAAVLLGGLCPSYIKNASSPKVAKTGYRFASCAWMAVMATVLTMSVTVQPRLRSFTGLLRPCNTGPTATALAERCTAL
jgi:hypothetical protein